MIKNIRYLLEKIKDIAIICKNIANNDDIL